MSIHIINEQIKALNQRFLDLQATLENDAYSSRSVLQSAFQELNAALEELSVAEEELRLQNEALAESRFTAEEERLRYQDLFDAAPDAYFVTDLEGIIRDVNQAALELLAIKRKFLLGKPLVVFVPQEEISRFRTELTGLVSRNQKSEFEMRFLPRNASVIDVAITVTVMADRLGTPQNLRWLIRDVTARHQNESELYRLLVEEVKDYAIFLTDPNGKIITWNGTAEHIFGYQATEAIGNSADFIFTPEDIRDCAPDRERRQASTEGRAQDERWHLRKDGTRFWASGILTALRDKSGYLRWYAKILRDMTARKEAEERLVEEYYRERQIAETFQQMLLPEVPENTFPGISIRTFYEAALSEANVGGDFFDVFGLPDGQVALVVGDISGKGLAAAVNTAEVKTALRVFLLQGMASERALSLLNDFVHENAKIEGRNDNALATLALVIVNPQTGRGISVTAGAEPPLILRANGQADAIPVSGRLLGIGLDASYLPVSFDLDPGDTVLLATDGITEARVGKECLDYEGLVDLAVQTVSLQSLEERGRRIITGARNFAAGSFHDDVCLLLARRNE